MSISREIAEIAQQVAGQLQGRATALKREESELETRLVAVRDQLKAANLTTKRLASFQETIRGELQCPRCWVADEVHSPLVNITGTPTEDLFRCHRCHLEISVPA